MSFSASSRWSSDCAMSATPRLDRASFEEVVATHCDEVLSICLSILRDHDLGANKTQETFLRLWRDLCRHRSAA